MFCPKCGAQLADDARFCNQCGYQIGAEPSGSGQPDEKGAAKAVNTRKVGIIAVIAAAVVVLVLICLIFGGRGYKKTVKSYLKYSMDGNAKKVLELLPDKMIDAALEDEDVTKKELIEELEDTLEYQTEWLDELLGENWKVSWEIEDAEDYDKDELAELKEDMKDEYGIKIKAAKDVTVELEVTAKGSDEDYSEEMNITVVKIGRSWYIIDF